MVSLPPRKFATCISPSRPTPVSQKVGEWRVLVGCHKDVAVTFELEEKVGSRLVRENNYALGLTDSLGFRPELFGAGLRGSRAPGRKKVHRTESNNSAGAGRDEACGGIID